MKGIRCRSYELCLLLVVVALSLPAGAANAQEDLVWPVQSKLLRNYDNAVDTWTAASDVAIWNTKDELLIEVTPYAGYRIAKAGFHIVDNPADVAAFLDKKGYPDLKLFEYVTEFGVAVDSYRQVVDLGTLDVCWSVDPTKCPPNRYVMVALEFQGVAERAYPDNWYVTYPLAKVEPGHFVDANVAGLTYRTVTQEGITGEEGQFWFLPGERVDFKVGSLPLGNALADRAVSPQDLFPGADLEDTRVLNVARLLQSLDGDGNPGTGSINITDQVVVCLERALAGFQLPSPEAFFSDDALVEAVISATVSTCEVGLVQVSKAEALENLTNGMMAGNLMKRNISKTPGAKSDKAQIEIMPVYVPARRSDGTLTEVVYHDAEGTVIEQRNVAKPIVVSYVDEVEGTGAMDVFIAISTDDGDTWKRRNISKTADKSSMIGYPGKSWKPMLEVADNYIFVAWTDKYCQGGRPTYAITKCPEGEPGCTVCRETADGTICNVDYPYDDAYWQDDLYGVGGPQRSVIYEDYPEMGEVPYSCVWAARGVLDPGTGDVQWYKPEKITSGRRDAFQLTAATGGDVAIGLLWQEDPKGLLPGEGDGPGEGWGGANTNNKTDIWMSYLRLSDFAAIDYNYLPGGHGDGDVVDMDPELSNRAKALVPMSIPIRITDNEVCSLENILAIGGGEEHDFISEHDGEGTHRYCGTVEGIGTAEAPGTNPLCAYTIERVNPPGTLSHVFVTADGRLLDGDTGSSRPNLNLQAYGTGTSRSAWVILGYEESKGVGIPPDDHEHDEEVEEDDHDTRYKPDMGKNVIYHSFDLFKPETISAGTIVNLPETDASGNPVYLVDEAGALLLDWKGEPQLAYENARRVRFLPQSPGKANASTSRTSAVILYRQGEEGSGKPADIFMRRVVTPGTGNPYAAKNIQPGAQNLSSVQPTLLFQDPFDDTKPVKMLRWTWTPANLADSSAKNPYSDARAHRGALNGDELVVAYTLTPNWGRRGNDRYELFVRRSFDGGKNWSTDPKALGPITHDVAFRVPIIDWDTQTVTWGEEIVTTTYAPGASEPPRNISNLRNNRISVFEPRLVKTPGNITDESGLFRFPEDHNIAGIYQIAFGVEFNPNQDQLPEDVSFPQMPLDLFYGRTIDKGQHYSTVTVTPQDGSGGAADEWNLLAKDHPQQGAPQVRQTPDGSRMYGIWVEETSDSSDIMFRRVDYR